MTTLIVGAGSSIASEYLKYYQDSQDSIILLSREKPKWIKSEHWIQTSYTIADGSIDKIKEFNCPSIVVWLASPFKRKLFVNFSEIEIFNELTGPILFQNKLVSSVLPSMISEGFGRFIFAGSLGAKLGDVGSALYTQVKYAQSGLSRAIAVEYGSFGISSNVVQIGLMSGGLAGGLSPNRFNEFQQRTSTKKPVSVADFWQVTNLLVHTDSLNGAEINLDGGFR